ncbi:MAG TPA: hypothetical protein VGF79_00340 [Bacteroidia bacterium]
MKVKTLVTWLGLLVFAILGIASIVYYRERVIYVDSAYYAFNMFNKGLPTAEHNRYALYLYQFVPWIFFKLGASIALVLKLFSICHILLHSLALFFILRMNKHKIGLLLILMQVVAYRECFFLTVNETALVISASLVLYALMQRHLEKSFSKTSYFICTFLCISIALLAHPMAMIVIPFVIMMHAFQAKKTFIKKEALILFAAFLLGFIIKKSISVESGYEEDLFNQLNNIGQIFSNFSEVYSFKFFYGDFKLQSYFFKIYIIPLVLIPFIIGLHIKFKLYLELTAYLVSMVGLWLLIIVLFNRGDGNIFMEKNYTPWVMISLFPLVYLPLEKIKYNVGIVSVLTVSILFYSIYGIYAVAPMYEKRLYLIDRLITEKNPSKANKLLLQDSTVNHDEWLGVWALPYETILLSKIKGMPSTTAKIYNNEERINKELNRDDIFIGADFIPVLPMDYLIRYKEFKIPNQKYIPVPNP